MTRVKVQSGDRLKTGDTDPDLVVTLLKDNDNPKDVTGATVSLHVSEPNEDTLVVDDDTAGNVTIEDGVNGVVSYSWQVGDTDGSGRYLAEFEVDDGADVSSYPNHGTFKVHIAEGLN